MGCVLWSHDSVGVRQVLGVHRYDKTPGDSASGSKLVLQSLLKRSLGFVWVCVWWGKRRRKIIHKELHPSFQTSLGSTSHRCQQSYPYIFVSNTWLDWRLKQMLLTTNGPQIGLSRQRVESVKNTVIIPTVIGFCLEKEAPCPNVPRCYWMPWR